MTRNLIIVDYDTTERKIENIAKAMITKSKKKHLKIESVQEMRSLADEKRK